MIPFTIPITDTQIHENLKYDSMTICMSSIFKWNQSILTSIRLSPGSRTSCSYDEEGYILLLTVGLLLFKVFNPMTTYTQLFSNLTPVKVWIDSNYNSDTPKLACLEFCSVVLNKLAASGTPLTYFNDGGEGGGGSEGFFWVYERRREFLGLWKQHRDFLGIVFFISSNQQ